jgi:hypothetical protein
MTFSGRGTNFFEILSYCDISVTSRAFSPFLRHPLFNVNSMDVMIVTCVIGGTVPSSITLLSHPLSITTILLIQERKNYHRHKPFHSTTINQIPYTQNPLCSPSQVFPNFKPPRQPSPFQNKHHVPLRLSEIHLPLSLAPRSPQTL